MGMATSMLPGAAAAGGGVTSSAVLASIATIVPTYAVVSKTGTTFVATKYDGSVISSPGATTVAAYLTALHAAFASATAAGGGKVVSNESCGAVTLTTVSGGVTLTNNLTWEMEGAGGPIGDSTQPVHYGHYLQTPDAIVMVTVPASLSGVHIKNPVLDGNSASSANGNPVATIGISSQSGSTVVESPTISHCLKGIYFSKSGAIFGLSPVIIGEAHFWDNDVHVHFGANVTDWFWGGVSNMLSHNTYGVQLSAGGGECTAAMHFTSSGSAIHIYDDRTGAGTDFNNHFTAVYGDSAAQTFESTGTYGTTSFSMVQLRGNTDSTKPCFKMAGTKSQLVISDLHQKQHQENQTLSIVRIPDSFVGQLKVRGMYEPTSCLTAPIRDATGNDFTNVFSPSRGIDIQLFPYDD